MLGRGSVTSIVKYHAVGFDMDHTLIRYKLRQFAEHLCEATAIYLTAHKGYPQEVFPSEDAEPENTYDFFFRAVYDHQTGNLLKMDANGMIMRAYHGFRRMTRDEIIAVYGKNPHIGNYHILSHRHPSFTNLHEFFLASVVPILARMVHLKATANLPFFEKKSFLDIMEDVHSAMGFNLIVRDVEQFRRQEYHGYFYPKFISHIRQYVHPVPPALLARLKRLRERGISVFIASNSTYAVAEVLLQATIGANWHEYFDFTIFECRKPSFFNPTENPPAFIKTNGEPVADLGKWLAEPKTGDDTVLAAGHASTLSQCFADRAGPDYKVLFFGDTIVSDCVYCLDKTKESNWDCVFILEELLEVENGMLPEEYFDYSKHWGSALHDKSAFSGTSSTNIFDFADSFAHRSFSSMSSPECLALLSVEESAAAEEHDAKHGRRSRSNSIRSGRAPEELTAA